MVIEHLAGEYEGLKQRCTRCGEVLIDNVGALVPEGTPAPRGFDPGPVYREGNMTTTAPFAGAVRCVGGPVH